MAGAPVECRIVILASDGSASRVRECETPFAGVSAVECETPLWRDCLQNVRM
jgi:hypothetical protein